MLVRIKVLTEKGKELATVEVPYAKGVVSVTDIKGRTIHPDGSIFALDVKPADLVEHKGTGVQLNKMVFTLPNVEVGSILEFKWQLRYDDHQLSSPDWEIQQYCYVRKAHYVFHPYKLLNRVVDSKGNAATRLLYSSMLAPPAKILYEENADRYVLDVADIPPIPREEYMPPLGAFTAQVHFYYTPYVAKDDFWKHEGGRWSKEMDRFADQGKLKDAASSIVAAGDAEDVKAHKIYDAVMKIDNTDYSRRKSAAELKELGLKETKSALNVWQQKSGSSDEIALLYLGLARAAGLKAYALAVSNRDRRIFSPYFLSLNQLDDDLVIVSINGKEVTLDPGRRMASFGELDWRHMVAGGLRQSDKGTTLETTSGNSFKEAATLRVADVTIDKTGKVTGMVRISMSGPAALRWRHLAIENDEDEVKKQFNESMHGMLPEGVEADFDHFLGLDDYHASLMGMVKLSGNMGTATGKRIFLPGVFFESRAKHPFVTEEKREAPIDMGYADMVRDDVTYHLPETYAVESAPSANSIPWTGHASFQLKSQIKDNQVEVARSLAKNFVLLSQSDYKDLRDFYQKVASADQEQLVLTVAPSSKGE